MALNVEWRDRLDAWRSELKQHFYRPLGEVELSGFATMEHLSPQEALKGDFQPMPAGTKWGAKWEYGWFKTRIVLPDEARNRRIVLRLEVTDKEAIIFVNGRMIESHRASWGHETLTFSGKSGEAFEILVEAAAGHGPTPCHAGPVPPGRDSVPEPPATQQQIGECTFGIWSEDAYQLHIDVETLFDIRENLAPESLRVARIDEALKDFTFIADFELPREQMLETLRAAREHVAPLLACRNGSTAPEMFCFGHGHLDVAWLWPLAETERKAARTLANQLALIEEYPEHRFLHSQAHLFRMVKRSYPDLYGRVKKAVAAGNIIAEGGMWVEADNNVTGGESLIRQFLHGKRFFHEEFGVDCRLLWLPDVFGYSAALPQILNGCGIKYFSTSKIFWTYHGGETFPYHNFIWEGIDGSEVIAHLHYDYNSNTSASSAIRRWKTRVQTDGMSTRLYPFGHGDGGGGPSRNHLEYLRRLGDSEGVPKMRLASPINFFEDLVRRGEHDVNRYVGELYFQAHRGVQTSQARTKKGNRRSELALREAEMWGAAAAVMKGFAWPADEIDEAWKEVLLNQFHDILPGSSIRRVYEEAEASHARVIDRANETASAALAALTEDADAITVFNSLGWPRRAVIELPENFAGAIDTDGELLCVQETGGRRFVQTNVPPCGWKSLKRGRGPRPGCDGGYTRVKMTDRSLENNLLRVELDDLGRVVSVFDKQAGRELLAGPSNVFRMYRDVPSRFDAWDIDSMYKDAPVDLAAPAEIQVVAEGPLAGVIRVSRKLNSSEMTQDILLQRDGRRVEFATTVDWHESHKLLKVCFVPDIHADQALHEIQFGHVRRPNHASRPYDADRFEVTNHKWTALAEEGRGFAVLNDCKYGVNVVAKSINLTLLRAPKAPDMTADQGRQEFTYAFYAWSGPLSDSGVVREACELNVPILTAAGSAGEQSLLSVDAPNVVIETVKPAEDASGDIIVRLYESKRTATRCTLTTTLPVASANGTDMLENTTSSLDLTGGRIALDLHPFEIKTLRLRQ